MGFGKWLENGIWWTTLGLAAVSFLKYEKRELQNNGWRVVESLLYFMSIKSHLGTGHVKFSLFAFPMSNVVYETLILSGGLIFVVFIYNFFSLYSAKKNYLKFFLMDAFSSIVLLSEMFRCYQSNCFCFFFFFYYTGWAQSVFVKNIIW